MNQEHLTFVVNLYEQRSNPDNSIIRNGNLDRDLFDWLSEQGLTKPEQSQLKQLYFEGKATIDGNLITI